MKLYSGISMGGQQRRSQGERVAIFTASHPPPGIQHELTTSRDDKGKTGSLGDMQRGNGTGAYVGFGKVAYGKIHIGKLATGPGPEWTGKRTYMTELT